MGGFVDTGTKSAGGSSAADCKVVKGFKVCYTNADVLSNKVDLLIARISVYDPDIICINEVKPKYCRYEAFVAEYNLSELGYEMFDNNMENKQERGQVLYVKCNIKAKRLYTDIKFEEVLLVEIVLRSSDRLLIALMYRSPSSTDDNNRLLNTAITKVANMGYSHLLILGDFNYKTISWNELSAPEGSVEECFMETSLENCLSQHVTDITRRRGNEEPSMIDLIFTNEEGMIDSITVHWVRVTICV